MVIRFGIIGSYSRKMTEYFFQYLLIIFMNFPKRVKRYKLKNETRIKVQLAKRKRKLNLVNMAKSVMFPLSYCTSSTYPLFFLNWNVFKFIRC